MKRLRHSGQGRRSDPELPLRLPISESTFGDHRVARAVREWVFERAEREARRQNMGRRQFLASSCGMATTLFALNLFGGCSRPRSSTTGNPDAQSTTASMPPVAPDRPAPGATEPPLAEPAGAADPSSTGTPTRDGGVSADGGFAVPEAACEDQALADLLMGADQAGDNELIIDMQTYLWTLSIAAAESQQLEGLIGQVRAADFPWLQRSPGASGSAIYGRTEYIEQVLSGPTTIAVISGLPYSLGPNGMGASGFAAPMAEDLLDGVEFLNSRYPDRVLGQIAVMPNDRIDLQLAAMERHAERCHSWKAVTSYLPSNPGVPAEGYWLHEGAGPRMLQKGIDLGRPIFSIAKGRALPGFDARYSMPSDIGAAARMFPQAHLVVSEAAFEAGIADPESSRPAGPVEYTQCGPLQRPRGTWPEGPYDESDASVQAAFPLERGVNSLIHALRSHNIGPNGRDLDDPTGPVRTHVYAEVGRAWPELMTSRHEEAMHFWGKLLKHLGEDRILWGTAGLWYGSPTPIIEAFRCFEISEALQTQYAYPALTPARKRKILGLNAARMTRLAEGANLACDEV